MYNRTRLYKLSALCLTVCIATTGVGCGRNKTKQEKESTTVARETSTTAGYDDGVIGENDNTDSDFIMSEKSMAESSVGEIADSSTYGLDHDGESDVNGVAIQSGTLTGGEIRDLKNWDNWLRNYKKDIAGEWMLNTSNRISVYVHNGNTPVNHARVKLIAGNDVVFQSLTAADGYAYLFYNLDSSNTVEPDSVQVEKEDGSFETYSIKDKVNSKNEMEVESDKQNKEMKLDLMFVVDTTGSMGDELEYLKAELQNVIERVHEESGANIRTSVNFYRDEGDAYIVKYFDFRDKPSEVTELIDEQSASGGGDYEEAVHTALDNAINEHNWDEDSTVRLLFIVLDAPPHGDKEVKSKIAELTGKAATEGIRIIPVVASGADDLTQGLMRTMGVVTGGTYIFLDDNSGIGYSHDIPDDVKDYDSEHLNNLLIRVIGEYCGVEIDPDIVEQTTEEESTTYKQ